MTLLFQRQVRVILGSLQIDDLRVAFKVKHNNTKEPNEATLSIFNLGPDSRKALQSKGTRIVIEAGYTGTIAQIFTGSTRFIDHKHDGSLWVAEVQSGDGDEGYRAPVLGSFKKGTPVATVFQQIAKQTGLDVSDATATVQRVVKEQFTKGYTAYGKGSVEIDRLLQGRGLAWSIQDNKLQLLEHGATTSDQALVLSPSTGLISSPAHGSPETAKKTPAVLTVKSLLQPSLRPGRKVRIESTQVTGNFVCLTVEHEGDTAGGAWWSTAEVTPI